MCGATVLGTVLLILLLVLLVQLNCRLQFLEIKILPVSFTLAFNVGDNLLVEFDAPCISLFAISLSTELIFNLPITPQMSRLIFKLATSQML